MKNKRNTYILFILVLAVWGMIGYRIFSSLNGGDDVHTPKNITISFQPKSIKKLDTFTINAHIRDPFLETFKAKSEAQQKKIIRVKKKVVWPKINYSGMMGDTNSNQKVFFIHINNTQYIMKLHDQMMDVKLIKANEREITIQFKGEQKKITINE